MLDLNHNGLIDSGRELFGNATLLPDGSTAANGFEALAVYDDPAFGGDGDGMITHRDRVWRRLTLWSDLNYDGISDRPELSRLATAGIRAIGLQFVEVNRRDGSLNLHWLQGTYVKRIDGTKGMSRLKRPILRAYTVEDIVFYFSDPEP